MSKRRRVEEEEEVEDEKERVARAATCTNWAGAGEAVGIGIQVAPPRGRHVRSLHPFHRHSHSRTEKHDPDCFSPAAAELLERYFIRSAVHLDHGVCRAN